MYFKDNFSDTTLLLNQPVHFLLFNDEKYTQLIDEFDIKLPTIKEVFLDLKFQNFLSIIATPIETLQEQFYFIENLSNHFQLFRMLILYAERFQFNYINDLIYSFKILGLNITIQQSNFLINNSVVGYNLFSRWCEIILRAADLKSKDSYSQIPEIQAKQKEIDRIKNQNKTNSKEQNNIDFEQILLILSYHLNYKIEEIIKLNVYLIHTLLGYYSNIVNYEVSKIATGNGLSKKLHTITDKKGRKRK